jgi:hypothetical protein
MLPLTRSDNWADNADGKVTIYNPQNGSVAKDGK